MKKINEKMRWAKPNLKWVVWFFPVVAVGISAVLAFDFMKDRGPMIQIKFPEAANVEAEKTTVQFRGIVVGKVVRVELSEDTKNVTVFVRLTRNAKKLSVEGAKYWVVQPEVGFEGVRGLETIFKGPYIRVEPGPLGGRFRDRFVGFIGTGNRLGGMVSFKIQSRIVDSIDVNDPVTFRGLKVGTISHVTLNKSGNHIDIRIGIEEKYAYLVRTNTNFWKKSGVQADLGLFGAKVNIGSLETLMKGGVAFATPDKAAAKAPTGQTFELLNEAPKDWMKWSPQL